MKQEEFINDLGYFIFDPRGNEDDFKNAYPELAEYDEFKPLNSRELVWVWCVSNATSPFMKIPFKERCLEATIWVFGQEHKWATKVNRASIIKMSKAEPDDKIEIAMEKMAKFSFIARKKADAMVMQIFSDLERVMKLKETDFLDKDDNVNYTAFINSRKLVRQELSELLPIVEKGFGVKKAGKIVDIQSIDGQGVHEVFHKNEFENNREE